MRYIKEHAGGYQVVLPNKPSKYFSTARYVSKPNASLAAQAYRDHYLKTGEEVVPRPLVLSRREMELLEESAHE